MSFILDALKKAEAERQRQTGPTLLEVRVAQPRRRFPTWTLVIGALLVINILLLIAFELHRPAPAAEPAARATPAAAAPVTAAPVAPAAPAAAPAIVAAPPPAPAPTAGPSIPPDVADQSGDNPADFEPAVSPGGAAAASAANSSTRRPRPPSLSDVGGDIPDLRLDLHVYAARPADRYALINMHRVHEGDVLPEGARVVAIDRDGVELTYHGTDFMLHPQ
jgi:general secretion pathway protein B